MMMMTTKYKIIIMTGDVTLAGNKEHGAGGLEEEEAGGCGGLPDPDPDSTAHTAKREGAALASRRVLTAGVR